MKRNAILSLILILALALGMIPAHAASDISGTKVSAIESGAFMGDSSLTDIVLPGELKTIGEQAFKDCSSLRFVKCYSKDVTVASDAFDGCSSSLAIGCYKGSTIDTYAKNKGIPRVYFDDYKIECNTVNNGCVKLPITWRMVNVLPSGNSESTFVYSVYRNGSLIYTGAETSEDMFVYTPTEAGSYAVKAKVYKSLITSGSSGEKYEIGTISSASVNVAAQLYLGTFEQDRNAATQDAILWHVIHVDGDRALLFSDKILKDGAYFNPAWIKYKYTYWASSYIGSVGKNEIYAGASQGRVFGCSPTRIPMNKAFSVYGTEEDLFKYHARYWCNVTFYDGAFTDAEKSRILLTTNVNKDNASSKIDGGPDTQDYVFFLSYEEASKYLTQSQRVGKNSAYANQNTKLKETKYWWLRSPGQYRVNAMYVRTNGSFATGGSDVGHDDLGYRPAMWISIGG